MNNWSSDSLSSCTIAPQAKWRTIQLEGAGPSIRLPLALVMARRMAGIRGVGPRVIRFFEGGYNLSDELREYSCAVRPSEGLRLLAFGNRIPENKEKMRYANRAVTRRKVGITVVFRVEVCSREEDRRTIISVPCRTRPQP